MITKSSVRFYVNTNNNAPQLKNEFGSMISVLDACLINGLDLGSISSLTHSQGVITAIFANPHNLLKGQVIKIEGANQTDYNTEHRVSNVLDATTITFNLTNPSATVATGNITAKLPPLDWEKPFSSVTTLGGGRAAYRSKNETLSNKPYLRVVDERVSSYNASYSKYAKVGIVETMTDIDTMSGVQSPYTSSATTRNWNPTGSGESVKNGWAKWYYYTPGEYYSDNYLLNGESDEIGDWFVIGTDTCFYIINSVGNHTSFTDYLNNGFLYGFGSFTPFAGDDLYTHYLLATNLWESASSIGYRSENYTNSATLGSSDSTSTTIRSIFLQRGYKKNTYAPATLPKAHYSNNSVVTGGDYASGYPVLYDFGSTIIQRPVLLETSLTANSFLPRGHLPLLRHIPHKVLYNNFQIIEEGDQMYLAKTIYGSSLSVEGFVLFDIGES